MANRDKRERLVKAAAELFFERSFERTTIADVASRAEVPLGNVYYYFKTKESLAEAVVEQHLLQARQWFERAGQASEPAERLIRWVDCYKDECSELIQGGCPLGTLLLALKRQSTDLGARVQRIFEEILSWLTLQFEAAGASEPSYSLACSMVARAQGISILAVALEDRERVLSQFSELQEWVRSVTVKP